MPHDRTAERERRLGTPGRDRTGATEEATGKATGPYATGEATGETTGPEAAGEATGEAT